MQNASVRGEAAQIVMPRINGADLEDHAYRAEIESLVREGIGGFILFGGDVKRTPQRIRDLQSLATTPLLISSDVERGLGQQLAGGTRFPGQRAIASACRRQSRSDEALLAAMLDAVRTESRAAGIHIVFSPVVDVNNNPHNPIICTRAFGEDPETVEWFGARYIRRLQKPLRNGTFELLACAKHFPGHGDTDQDSHSVLPVIRAEKARLNRVELPPFREAVKDGVGTVMVAHLMVPALEPSKPTTFSKKIITALLREGMGFEGLIVSDALDMGALANDYSQEEIAVRALEAGIDILLHPVDARRTIKAVLSAVEEGRLTAQRVRESAGRVLAAKTRLGLFDEKARTPRIAWARHRRIAREIAAKAPEVIAAGKTMLPLKPSGGAACFVLDDDAQGMGKALLERLGRKFRKLSSVVLAPGTVLSQAEIAKGIGSSGSVIVAIFSKISASKGRSGISADLEEAGRSVLKAAQAAGSRTVVISFDSPYILDHFREADVRIAAYDRMDEIQQAAGDMLTRRKA